MSWTTITPLSKFLALICFILFPFIGFYLGMQYQKILTKPAVYTTTSKSSCVSQVTCSEEAKRCADGSYVFREKPTCDFAPCQDEGVQTPPVSLDTLQKISTKEEQITVQVSQKTGISKDQLTIQVKPNTEKADSFAGGTYTSPKGSGGWIAAKQHGIWLVTAAGNSTPKCSDVDPYHFPSSLLPACKKANGDITAR